MIGTRYEEYEHLDSGLPFILHVNLERTPFTCSKEKNWHENLEIQLCTDGCGTVLLNGERYSFNKNEIVVVNSDVIHHTGTDQRLIYTCLIVSPAFCRQMGIDCGSLTFTPHIKSFELVGLLNELTKAYGDNTLTCRTAKLNELLLRILIELTENHSVKKDTPEIQTKSFERVKAAVKYIRKNYSKKITLDGVAKAVFTDKYALCRDFKRLSGQTIIEYTNNYRCMQAAEYMLEGHTVTEAAEQCGFENLSFFTKTFKKHMGFLPSEYKSTGH